MHLSSKDILADLVIDALTEGPCTGFEIARILEHDFEVSLRGREGALYAELLRLERGGFVLGDWVGEETERRRHYRLPVLVDLNALTAPMPGTPEDGSPDDGSPDDGVQETGPQEMEE
jgi:hypothetical protein